MQRERGAREKRRDERWETLKRRVQLLSRLDGAVVTLASGPAVASIAKVVDPERLVAALRERGALDAATFEATVASTRPLVAISTALVATAHRDLRALDATEARAIAREHARALARYGRIDDAWVREKRERAATLAAALAAHAPRRPDDWFASVLEIVRAAHGAASADAIAAAAERLASLVAERRREAEARVEALAAALESHVAPEDAALAGLVERLARARALPGRARRKATLEVLEEALAWPIAGLPAQATRALAEPTGRAFEDALRDAGRAIVRTMPAARDPSARDDALSVLAFYGLAFRVGDDGVPLAAAADVAKACAKKGAAAALASSGVTLAQALAIVDLPLEPAARAQIARWVAEGLELELVERACAGGHGAGLAAVSSARAARAYATWATRLVPHYASLGIEFTLSPELFSNLPKNEDLAVLAICLMERRADDAKEVRADPIAVLDATLGLFHRLPGKASGVLARLRGSDAGAGRRLFPDFAAWLGDDALLDRYVHVARSAGEAAALTKQLRADFDHAAKAARERAHLESLASRSDRQEARLAALRARDRSLAAAPVRRTKRRIAERIDELLPVAYRRELDAAFRDILREAWGIAVPSLTEAWRDAVRFWLVVDDNRELLGRLLRACAASPGRDVKLAFPKNRAWIDAARRSFDVDAWLAPRHAEITTREGTRLVLALEEDPLEVLRMGIPFGTCLALDSGCNAASTVVNAVDANKRVLYVRAKATGRVVARKLLAITTEHRVVGYHLYVSAAGEEERAIREAVEAACRAIAADAGLPLAVAGVPASLHGGFWYDDGTVPFGADADVASYCAALGLPPPERTYDALVSEARAWAATERGDVEAAIAALTRWDRGPANERLGAWIVDRLGATEAARRAEDDASMALALVRMLARDEAGMVRALGFAPRLHGGAAPEAIEDALVRFLPSQRLARALAEAAVRTAKLGALRSGGLVDRSTWTLPRFFVGVADAFDALDAVAPAWEAAAARVTDGDTAARAAERSIDAVVAAFARAPDEDAVVACLMSRRRSAYAHRAALGVAARWVLPSGARALVRFASLRPELARAPALLGATLRQERADAVSPAFAKRLPSPDAPPFEALADLVVAVRGLDAVLAPFAPSDLVKWAPGPWEAAYYRRHLDHPALDALLAVATRSPLGDVARARGGAQAIVTYAHEALASLGDVGRLQRVRALAASADAPREKLPRGARWKTETECLAVARGVAAQVAATRAGAFLDRDVGRIDVVDRAFAALALAALSDGEPPGPRRDRAIDVVLGAPGFTAEALARELVALGADDAAVRALARASGASLDTATIARAYARGGEVRAALLESLVRIAGEEYAARAWAAERAAEASGASAEGLLEDWAVALAASPLHGLAVQTETLDQLRSIVRAVVERAEPLAAARFYGQLPDELAVSLFVRAVARAPRDRAAAIREAFTKVKIGGPRGDAMRAWLARRSS